MANFRFTGAYVLNGELTLFSIDVDKITKKAVNVELRPTVPLIGGKNYRLDITTYGDDRQYLTEISGSNTRGHETLIFKLRIL